MTNKLSLTLYLILFLVFFSCKKENDIPDSIKFNTSTRLPILSVQINGINARLLLDTGATVSLIDSSTIRKYNFNIYSLPEENMRLSGVGGTIYLYEARDVNVFFEGEPMNIKFKSANLRNLRYQLGIVGVIGTDYLNENKMVIDYKNKVLRKSTILD